MEKKKMKIWKKILIVLVVLLILYLVTCVYKYCVLSKLLNTSKKTTEISNYHVYAEHSGMVNGIFEYWRKDDILKTNLKNDDVVLTLWSNSSTGEKYFINNMEKIYMPLDGEVARWDALPVFAFSDTVDYELCFNPLFIIYPKKYNNTNCYCLTKYNEKSPISTESKSVAIIDKKTCFSLYNNDGSQKNVNYDFGTVTDEDVKLPNLEEYTFRENNSN